MPQFRSGSRGYRTGLEFGEIVEKTELSVQVSLFSYPPNAEAPEVLKITSDERAGKVKCFFCGVRLSNLNIEKTKDKSSSWRVRINARPSTGEGM